MSAGDIDDTEADPSLLTQYRRESKQLDKYLEWAWKLRPIRSFFIPFAAGASEDGKTVYISHDLQTYFETIELESALVRHETTEWGLRHFLEIGTDYDDDPMGHRIANNAEFDRVRQLLDRPNALELYEEWIDPQVLGTERTDIKGRPIPRDLALFPYVGSKLYDELQEEAWNDRSIEEWEKIHPESAQSSFHQDEEEEPAASAQLTRDCFLYLNPKPPESEFAQCATCRMWVPSGLCSIHGPDIDVTGEMSCGLYVHGEPLEANAQTSAIVTPEESGLVDRDVRCENCVWGGPDVYQCALYICLNSALPNFFALDPTIDPKGCCNAQQPRKA